MKLFALIMLVSAVVSHARETGARYLIITIDEYAPYLKPLADWKTQKGVRAKTVCTSETGSDSVSIRDFVINAYNTWLVKPEYLLIVGNDYQIPFPQFIYNYDASNSDNYYANVTGDFHNEIIPGRLWVFDTADVKTWVAKILGYEKTPFTLDPMWFKKGTTIVCEDEYGIISDTIYWADSRYAHELMAGAGYVHIDSFSKYRGHTSYDVINSWNDGRAYIMYRGIGVYTWDWPFWDIDTSQMYNGYKLPVIISATCATIEGIGYTWTNAGSPEQPKGAVGFYGTTTALYDAAPFRSALAKGTLQSIFCDSNTTLGRAAEAGRLEYVAIFGNTLEYNSWTCLGDPEMALWTTTPRLFEVTHETEFTSGACTVHVNVRHQAVPVESVLVCIMAKQDVDFYKYGYTNASGDIQFIDTVATSYDTVLITATCRNYQPYMATMPLFFGGGPYVKLSSFSISDISGGNGDSVTNPGENIELPLWVMNWGDSTALGVLGSVRSVEPDPWLVLDDTVKYFGDVMPHDSAYTSADGYNAEISSHCPDLHEIEIYLACRDAYGETWNSPFVFMVHAPLLVCDDYFYVDSGRCCAPGDTAVLFLRLHNTGSYRAESTLCRIFSKDTFVTFLDSAAVFGTIPPESSRVNDSAPFVIITDPATPFGRVLHLEAEVRAGVYVDTADLFLYVGLKDYLIWDPDPNHTSGPTIKTRLDSLGYDGTYATEFPLHRTGLYRSLFVCAGIYPNRYVIRDTSHQAREIRLYLSMWGGRVYMEGGDLWYGDPHSYHGYDFNPLFKINPVANSIGTFTGIYGTAGTFTQGMSFAYQGAATMIDYIDSINGSQLLFRSTNWDRGCAVAADHRTVGMSFELAGLADTTAPSTRMILLDSIMRYFGLSGTGTHEVTEHRAQGTGLSVYPNPFSTPITISVGIEHGAMSKETGTLGAMRLAPCIKIYDATGRLVKSFNLATPPHCLADCSLLANSVEWHGRDDAGRIVPPGVYFVVFQIDDTKIMKKIVMIR